MTLLKILLEELEKWPEQAASAWQSEVDREVYLRRPDGITSAGGDYYSKYTADIRGPEGRVTKEEFLKAQQLKKNAKKVFYCCPICDSLHQEEYSARYCCELKTFVGFSCSVCHGSYVSSEAAEICCRSLAKTSEVDVKTVLYAAFDLVKSHREISDNKYTAAGGIHLVDIECLLQDYIEQNGIEGFSKEE